MKHQLDLLEHIKNYLNGNTDLLNDDHLNIKEDQSIVLVVIDGLGYEYLKTKQDSFLYQNLVEAIQTSYPPTTTCSNTVFYYGKPVAQHGLTGWFMNEETTDKLITTLPFIYKTDHQPLEEEGLSFNKIMGIDTFYKDIEKPCYFHIVDYLSESAFTKYSTRGATIMGFDNYQQGLENIKALVSGSNKKSYHHLYISDLDALGHEVGTEHASYIDLFYEIDNGIKVFANNQEKLNVTLIVTADHGMVNIEKDNILILEDLAFYQYLRKGLAGDSRFFYAYVNPNEESEFLRVINEDYKHCFECHKSIELLEKGFFGDGDYHHAIKERIGDFVLICKDGYAIVDRQCIEEEGYLVGHHSGLTSLETLVPLVVISC